MRDSKRCRPRPAGACLVVCFAVLGVLLARPAVVSPEAAAAHLRCERVVFAVALAPGEPADRSVVSWLCARGALHGKTIQVLVHGATYDHHVWDFPYRPDRYSYVRAATAAGYATLNLDRLGHGQSSRLPGDAVDLEVGAFALHQIVQSLRSGAVVTRAFGAVEADKILLAGESAGGTLVWMEAGIYGDVDGIVVAGAAHTFSDGLERVMQATWPVEDDPLLRRRGFPPGYFTTVPGTRGLIYYHAQEAELLVILIDELLKQTVTSGEIAGLPDSLPLSQLVSVPTLVTVGDFDDLFCDPPSCTGSGSLDGEIDQYGPGSCAELLIVPDSGHVLNLHRNAPDYFALVTEWADRRVGPRSGEDPPDPCDE